MYEVVAFMAKMELFLCIFETRNINLFEKIIHSQWAKCRFHATNVVKTHFVK